MNIKTLEIHAWDIIRNRNDYSIFEVIALPEVFALGKSSIKFRVRDGSLMKDSAINFIAEDYYGRRINYDVLDFIDENSCRIITIDITKKTSAGISRIAFYGTARNGKYVTMILEVPVDKSDVVSTAPLYVEAPRITVTEFSASVVQLNIPQIEDESDLSGNTFINDPTYISSTRRRFVDFNNTDVTYSTSKNTFGGDINTNATTRFQELSYIDDGGRVVISGDVLYMDSSKTFIHINNNLFSRSMKGGRIVIGGHTTNIIEVLSEYHIQVYPPFRDSNFTETLDMSIEYNDDVMDSNVSGSIESFLKLQFEGLTPDSGDLSSIEVLGKAVGSVKPLQVMADVIVGTQSVLIDESSVYIDVETGGRFGRVGSDLLDYNFDDYWDTSNVNSFSNVRGGRSYHKGVRLEPSGNFPRIETLDEYMFRRGSIYRLSAKFNIVENNAKDNSIYVVIPDGRIRVNEQDLLPSDYNNFIEGRGIEPTDVVVAKTLVSGSVVFDELFEFNGDGDSVVAIHFNDSDSGIQMEYIDIEVDSERHRPSDTFTALVPLQGANPNSEYNFTTRFKSSHGLYSRAKVDVNGFKVTAPQSIPSGSLQTISYDSGSGELSISGGNSVVLRPGGGSLGDLHEVLYFTGSASTSWSSSHSLGKIPSINIFTLDGGVYTHGRSTITEATTTNVSVEFRYSQVGFLVLN